jgi:hypothetical protein
MNTGYVGARRVTGCKCVFCRSCLLHQEILYTTENMISLAQAIQGDLRCSGCGARLYTRKEKATYLRTLADTDKKI